MSMTKRGIVYDLYKSPYRVTYDNIKFIFSSQLHQDKFVKRRQENVTEYRKKLEKKYGLTVLTESLFDVLLYKEIETRGFLIYSKGDEITCLKAVVVTGEELKRNCSE